MQVTPHVHALRLPFKVPVAPGIVLDRFVYAFQVYGTTITLIDTGVAGCEKAIFDDIIANGRDPSEISLVIQTHAHPDHIGATQAIQRATGCDVAVHAAERGWIQDVALQDRERPVPGFDLLVGGPAQVTRVLEDGDVNSNLYDSIGRNYNQNRAADPRVLTVIEELLERPLGSAIADVGAGTGNYSNALADLGYKLEAVEPSVEMRRQAIPNPRVHWLSGSAEAIPLKNNSVDGVIIILALHHFYDIPRAAREMYRICPNGPIVIFTMDPRKSEQFWFDDYFPEIAQHVFKVFPPIDEVADIISGTGKWQTLIKKFPLPPDLADRNMCSAWAKPEMYFDVQMRRNTSGFALASPAVVERGLKRLQHDLQSGQWDSKYGHLRRRKYFDAGFRFLRFTEPKRR